MLLTLLLDALNKRVASVGRLACACDGMTYDRALGVDTARTWARVNTLVIDASLCAGTVRIDDTFWPAVGWCAYIAR